MPACRALIHCHRVHIEIVSCSAAQFLLLTGIRISSQSLRVVTPERNHGKVDFVIEGFGVAGCGGVDYDGEHIVNYSAVASVLGAQFRPDQSS